MSLKSKRKVTKRELKSLESGLKIENYIQVTYPKEKSIFNIIFLIMITLLGLFGTILSFITLFDIPVDIGKIFIYSTIFFAMFSIINLLPDKFLISTIPILLVYLYILKDYLEEIVLGFKIVVNSVAYAIHTAGVWSKYFDIPSNIVKSDYTTIFLIFCIFLITCLICIFTIKLQSCVLGFILTFPFIECGLYFGLVPNYFTFFMVVCYWIALLSMALSGYKKNTKLKNAGFVRVGNSFYAKSNSNFQISEKIGFYTILMCILAVLLSSMIVSASGYERSNKIDEIRNQVKESVENISLENAPYMLSRLGSLLSDNNNGSFNGTLGQKDNIEYDDIDKLYITTDSIPSSDIYLKSYVGSIYTGQSWDMIKSKDYDNSLLNGFKSNGIYPQTMIYNILDTEQYSHYNLTVEPIKKNLNTTFSPYISKLKNDFTYTNDTLVTSKEKNQYSFDVINVPTSALKNNTAINPLSSYLILTNDISPQFDYETYSQFIQDNYLTVDENESMQVVKSYFSEYLMKYNLNFDEFNESASVYNKLSYIRDFLCYNYEYTLSPGKTPIGEDYVEYFLTQTDSGFCSHFASTGIILCRMLDIPARYVEGYYVKKSLFSENQDGSYKVSVKDNMAHAWAEIYIENLGWINYEFTPGFDNNPTKADLINAPQNDTPQEEPQSTEEVTQPVQSDIVTTQNQESVTTTIPQDNPQNEVSTSNENISNNNDNSTKFEIPKAVKHIILIVLIIALIVAFIILRRKYIIENRLENIHGKDSKKSVLASYKYVVSLLSLIGYTRDEHTQHLDFANEVSKQLKYAKDFPQIMDIVLQSDLSQDEISQQDRELVNKFALTLSDTIYDKQNAIGKFLMKYILCLK